MLDQGQNSLPANRCKIRFSACDTDYPVVALDGREALSEEFRFSVELLVDPDIDVSGLIGASGRLEFDGQDATTHHVAGLVTAVEETGQHNARQAQVRLQFESHLARLRHHRDTRIILGLNVPDIVRATCEQHDFGAHQVRFDLVNNHPVRPYTLQANESDLAFICRLLASAGIFFFSVHEDGGEVVIFTDHNTNCPYLDRDVLEYRPVVGLPAGHSGKAPPGLHELSVRASQIANEYRAHGYSEDMAGSTLLASTTSTGPVNQIEGTEVTRFDAGTATLEATHVYARHMAEHARSSAWELLARGNVSDMAAGRSFGLSTRDFDPRYSGDYLITAVEHRASQRAGPQVAGIELAYQNSLRCIRRDTPYRPAPPAPPSLPITFTARIESDGAYAQLDEQGRYRLRSLFDLSGRGHAQASIPLRRISPHGGLPGDSCTGFHTPLQDGTEVLLSCLNGDPDRPVIVGATPNPDMASPVTSANASQNRLRSRSDNELCLDDQRGQEAITLRTCEGHNILHLDATAMGHRIRLASQHGAMHLWTKKTIRVESGDSITERSGADRIQIAENAHHTRTRNAEIHYHAATDFRGSGYNNVASNSGANTELTAGTHLRIDAHNRSRVTVKGGGLHARVQDGAVFIQAARDIRIEGRGGGDIAVEQSGGGFRIDPAGNITMYGKRIALGGSGGVSFNGPVNFTIGAPSVPSAATVDAPMATTPVAPLGVEFRDVALIVDNPAGSNTSYRFVLAETRGGYRQERTYVDSPDSGSDGLELLFEQLPVPGRYTLTVESDVGTEVVFEDLPTTEFIPGNADDDT